MRFLLALLIALAAAFPGRAQDGFWAAGATYDPAVTTPAEYLGFPLGERLARYDKVTGYVAHLAEISERVSVETIGYSHEHRPILLATVSTPENHARMDDLKSAHLARSADAPDLPVVTWISYGVHGDEISGIEAAMAVIYHLAAVTDPEWLEILENSVVLNVVTMNPDGRDRAAHWYNMFNGVVDVADPNHIEHIQGWPGGRMNHYWFDLNRQWLPATQPESRAWLGAYHEWKPHVVVDFHEMGPERTYYFHPGEPGRTHPRIPAGAEALLERISRYPAAHLDEEQRPYFTAERYDNYYIGKGSTYPAISGGVGILFEQSGSEGITFETDNGPQVFRENIRQHMNSGLAIIRGAAEMRADLRRYQREFFESAADEGRRAPARGYVFAAPGDPARENAFLDLLVRHEIEVYRLARDLRVNGVNYAAGRAYAVPAAQPYHRLLRGIFDQLTEFPRDSFYDISGWTLPYAYGLRFAALDGGDWSDRLVGERAALHGFSAAALDPDAVGYILDWNGFYAPRALNALLEAGYRPRVATKEMTVATPGGRVRLDPGAIVVSPGNTAADLVPALVPLLEKMSADHGVAVYAATAGLTPEGPDLGGSSQTSLTEPEILLAVGEGVRAYDAGELWFMLDHEMRIPVTLVRRDLLPKFNLSSYSHLILPDGDYDDFDEEAVEHIKDWVKGGGTLIATQDAAFWAAEKELAEARELKLDEAEQDDDKAAEEEAPPERFAYGEKSERDARDRIAGAVFMTDVDRSHPIGFGVGTYDLASHRDDERFFKRHANPYASVAVYDENPLVSGYAAERYLTAMAGTPSVVAERAGKGAVILFADNPVFRGYWLGTTKLLMNAIFFSKAFEAE